MLFYVPWLEEMREVQNIKRKLGGDIGLSIEIGAVEELHVWEDKIIDLVEGPSGVEAIR